MTCKEKRLVNNFTIVNMNDQNERSLVTFCNDFYSHRASAQENRNVPLRTRRWRVEL